MSELTDAELEAQMALAKEFLRDAPQTVALAVAVASAIDAACAQLVAHETKH